MSLVVGMRNEAVIALHTRSEMLRLTEDVGGFLSEPGESSRLQGANTQPPRGGE